MKLIVGLGNIGRKYEGTRHNIGFMVADELARRWSVSFREGDNSFYAEVLQPVRLFLIKPTTYMNLSGIAVGEFAHFYHIPPEDILVIQDDMDLPCGRLRVRRKGSSGGHNGLKSIIEDIGSSDFPRIKIGIGHPGEHGDDVITHVLQRFSTFEEEAIREAVTRAADAVELWLRTNDVGELMQVYNVREKPSATENEEKKQEEPPV